MTEGHWLTSSDAYSLLSYLGKGACSRRLRLFAVACFRYDWKSWTRRKEQVAVLTAEMMADGLASEEAIEKTRENLAQLLEQLDEWGDLECIPHVPECLLYPDFGWRDAVVCIGQVIAQAQFGPEGFDGCEKEVETELASLLRDVFGNPFHQVAFDPRCRTADVMGLARGIYDDRVFERLPMLGDALMDAGCDIDRLLAHLLATGTHVTGCWAVDLVLGRE
jgi:hypothetical protein